MHVEVEVEVEVEVVAVEACQTAAGVGVHGGVHTTLHSRERLHVQLILWVGQYCLVPIHL